MILAGRSETFSRTLPEKSSRVIEYSSKPGKNYPILMGVGTSQPKEKLKYSRFVIPAKAGIQKNQGTGHRFSPV